tara:strand:+ start:180 stop:464 length:285 start_codon:yes stop_codon:yes gene_type:complete
MIKLKKLLNEKKGDLKEVKSQLKHLDEYLKSKEEALKKYKKWYELIRRKPENIDVSEVESLLEKHRDLVVMSFNKQTHFTIENLLKEVKKLEND